jgi:hypothetical protein
MCLQKYWREFLGHRSYTYLNRGNLQTERHDPWTDEQHCVGDSELQICRLRFRNE